MQLENFRGLKSVLYEKLHLNIWDSSIKTAGITSLTHSSYCQFPRSSTQNSIGKHNVGYLWPQRTCLQGISTFLLKMKVNTPFIATAQQGHFFWHRFRQELTIGSHLFSSFQFPSETKWMSFKLLITDQGGLFQNGVREWALIPFWYKFRISL